MLIYTISSVNSLIKSTYYKADKHQTHYLEILKYNSY